MKLKKEINELDILQYINNELSDQEYIEVEEWINNSEENHKLAEDLIYLSFAVSSLQLIKRSAPQKALQKVHKRIRVKKSSQLFFYFQRIAAILLIPSILLSVYLLSQPKTNEPLSYLEARMTPGMMGSLVLSDGTKVWLNSSSSLTYPNTFSGQTREVVLDGEAYFEVIENTDCPFIVNTENTSVTVLGTKFNMDAYKSNSFVTTTLVEGAIEFNYRNNQNKNQTILMEENDQVQYTKNSFQAQKYKTYVPKDIAWKSGQIILKDTPLSDILWILSKRFNIDFIIKDPSLYKHSFTGVFTNQQIERVLDHFKRSSGIRYKINHQFNEDGETTKSQIELF